MSFLGSLASVFLDPEFERKREFLQRIPLFRGISRRQFGTLFKSLAARHYHRGEVLFNEGDIGRALFLLESGRIELTRLNSDGRPHRLATLSAGEYFGEMALLEERPRTATATALEEVRAYLLYKSELEKLLRRAPAIGAAIMAHLAQLLSARLRTSLNPPSHPQRRSSDIPHQGSA